MNYLLNLDYRIFEFFNAWAGKSEVGDKIVVFIGHDLPYVVAAGLFILWLIKRKNANYIISAFASALVARFVIVELIRAIIYRPRPFLSHGVVQLINKGSEPSFPSGHAAFLFAIALAIYFYDRRLGLALFIIAVFISAARIVAGVHYPADILGGAILGIVVAWGTNKLLAGKLEKIS